MRPATVRAPTAIRRPAALLSWAVLTLCVCLGPLEGQSRSQPSAATPVPPGELRTVPRGVSTAPVRSGPVEVDGRVVEEAWLSVPVLPMVQQWPEYGADRTERTRVRVLHDEEHLWISGVFLARPGDVRGVSLYRDRWNGDDAVDILVDGRNDDVTGLKFTTTPLGIRIDGEIRNDASSTGGVDSQNDEWNGVWMARSRILPGGGWSFEVRIPLEILGIPRTEGPPTVGLIVSRYHAVGDDRDIFPDIPPEWPNPHLKPSLAHDLELPAAEPGTPLFVTPYLLAGAERTRSFTREPLRPPETDYPLEVGGELRVGLGPSLTLDLTANTDFAQAESDQLQVNLDRFNLFFPEKRQFFQERASTFQFQMGPEIRLFHSRTIGLDPTGSPQRIWGGGRLTGTVGGWDLGGLSLQVDGGATRPDVNDAVVRVRRALGREGTRVGGIVTARLASGGGRDVTAGMDAQLHLGGDDFVTVQASGTANEGDGEATLLERSALRLFWERRRVEGFYWALEAVRSGTDFRPVLGFEARDAYTSLVGDLTYSWRPDASSPVARYRLIATTRAYWRTGPGTLQSALQRFRSQFIFRNGYFWNTAVNLTLEDLAAPLTLPGATVPAGRYRGVDLFTNVSLPSAYRFGGRAILHAGRVFDGWRARLTLAPRLNFSRHLSVSPEVELQRLFFPDRGQEVRADRLGLRLSGALDTRLSAETFLQYNRASERFAAFVRLRLHLGEGRDVFLVYDGVRDLGDLADPRLRELGRTDGRLLLKVTHTFRW